MHRAAFLALRARPFAGQRGRGPRHRAASRHADRLRAARPLNRLTSPVISACTARKVSLTKVKSTTLVLKTLYSKTRSSAPLTLPRVSAESARLLGATSTPHQLMRVPICACRTILPRAAEVLQVTPPRRDAAAVAVKQAPRPFPHRGAAVPPRAIVGTGRGGPRPAAVAVKVAAEAAAPAPAPTAPEKPPVRLAPRSPRRPIAQARPATVPRRQAAAAKAAALIKDAKRVITSGRRPKPSLLRPPGGPSGRPTPPQKSGPHPRGRAADGEDGRTPKRRITEPTA